MLIQHPDDHEHGLDLEAALDFLNTRELESGQLVERLERPTDARGWFVGQGQLEPGAFRLGLLRGSHILDLAPDARLVDAGVVEGDVLHLVTNEPQIDGE